MSRRAAYRRWLKTRKSDALRVSGSFFVKVASVLTGARPSPRRECGDLILDQPLSSIEVKGQGRRAFRIEWLQLLSILREIGEFPGIQSRDTWYFLGAYEPRESRAEARERGHAYRRSLLGDAIRKGRGEPFLAERTNGMYILSVETLRAFKRRVGLQDKLFPAQPDVQGLVLNQTLLRDCSFRTWTRRTGNARLFLPTDCHGEVPMHFPVTLFHRPGEEGLPLHHVTWDDEP